MEAAGSLRLPAARFIVHCSMARRVMSNPSLVDMNKRAHVAAARTILESGQDSSLGYAALELRMAIETITYEKLRAHAKRLPESVLETWQPPQAMKALLEFEPHGNREKRVAFGEQPAAGQRPATMNALGETRSFDLTWLRSAYHRLGNFLHVPAPRRALKAATPVSVAGVRSALNQILAEVARVSEGTLEGGIAVVVHFNCFRCEQTVWSNTEAVRVTKRAVCLNPACAAVHVAEINDKDEFTFVLDAVEATCADCGEVISIERRHISLGSSFVCESCKATYEFTHVTYEYDRKRSTPKEGA